MTTDANEPWAARDSTHRLFYVVIALLVIAELAFEGYATWRSRHPVAIPAATSAPANP